VRLYQYDIAIYKQEKLKSSSLLSGTQCFVIACLTLGMLRVTRFLKHSRQPRIGWTWWRSDI